MSYVTSALMLRRESKLLIFWYFDVYDRHISKVWIIKVTLDKPSGPDYWTNVRRWQ